MRPCRILMISDHSLFAESISRLVQTSPEVQVMGVVPHSDQTLKRVKELHPDVVILCDDEESAPTYCSSLLDIEPQMRVIRLATDGNVIHTYEGHQLLANHAQDLVHVLDTFLHTLPG